MSEGEQASAPDDFLADSLATALGEKPARWTLKIIVANKHDRTDDPTEPWGGDHREVKLGVIEITGIVPDDPSEVFDPSQLPAGVHAPQDAVFGLRSAAYAVSYERRQT